MDTSKIEEYGVDAVKHYINGIDCARHFINTNDKTPLWDGYIYVYKTDTFENKNLDFIVPLQIKASDYSQKAITGNVNYQVRLDDLAQYERNGGLVFFFVALDKERNGHIFYAALTKARIQNLITTAKGKKGRSISLKTIPNDTNEFLNEIHKIALQVEFPVLSLPQLVGKKGYEYEIKAERIPKGVNFLDYIATHPVNMFVTKTGDTLKYFVDGVASVQLRQRINQPVCVGKKKYYDGYYSTSTNNGRKIEIGECMKLLVPYQVFNDTTIDDNVKIKLHIDIQPKDIDSAIKQNTFIYEALSFGEIEIGKEHFNLKPEEREDLKQFIDYCKQGLDFWKNTKKVFDILHVDYYNFVPSKISKLAEYNIRTLIRAFIDHKPVYGDIDYDHVSMLNVDNLNILVGAKFKGGKEFMLFDIYDDSVTASADFNGKRLQVPIYSPLIANYDHLPSNIYFDGMIESYEKLLSINPEIISRANNDGLFLIRQYDKTGNKKILLAAKTLFEWMLSHKEVKNKDVVLYRINMFQVIKRIEGTLSDKENDDIMDIMNSTDDFSIKFACSVLLDEFKSATYNAHKMSSKKLEEIKQYPIYTLYKKGKAV